MGCYPSSQSYCESRMPRREPSIGSLPGIYYNKSKPFKRNGLIWTSDIPITLSELEHKRTLFWQAAPTHGVSMFYPSYIIYNLIKTN
jgi:hypothetical protein